MAYHAIVNGATIPVYSRSSCAPDAHYGDLYPGEVFIDRGITTGYTNVHEVLFLTPSGKIGVGFIDKYGYGNLMYSGTRTSTAAGVGYAFYLRKALELVKNSGARERTLPVRTIIYTNTGTAGESNPQNIDIIGYSPGGFGFTQYDGFVTLDYTAGSMLASNFCLMK